MTTQELGDFLRKNWGNKIAQMKADGTIRDLGDEIISYYLLVSNVDRLIGDRAGAPGIDLHHSPDIMDAPRNSYCLRYSFASDPSMVGNHFLANGGPKADRIDSGVTFNRSDEKPLKIVQTLLDNETIDAILDYIIERKDQIQSRRYVAFKINADSNDQKVFTGYISLMYFKENYERLEAIFGEQDLIEIS